jgi:[ribosomal protein S5]-alanine N-acetyltransferase
MRSSELHSPWMKFEASSEAFAAYLTRSAREDQLSYLLRYGGQLAGFVNANNIVRGAFKSCFLGYGTFQGFERRGVMRSGLALVLTDLFENHDLHRAEANIQPGNEPSLRLVASLNFEKEGFSKNYLFVDGAWRDHERWAITKEHWLPES